MPDEGFPPEEDELILEENARRWQEVELFRLRVRELEATLRALD